MQPEMFACPTSTRVTSLPASSAPRSNQSARMLEFPPERGLAWTSRMFLDMTASRLETNRDVP